MECPVCNFSQVSGFSLLPMARSYAEDTWAKDHCFADKEVAICPDCDSGFIYPSVEDEELESFYKHIFNDGDVQIKQPRVCLPQFHRRYFSQTLYLKNLLELKKLNQVLEVGSNEVSVLPALSLFNDRISFHYYDQIDSKVISFFGGRRRGKYADGGTLRQDFGPDFLDFIHTSHSLEHINPSSIGDLLGAVMYILKPGGHFFIEVPFDRVEDMYPPHTLFFTPDSLEKKLSGIGFEIIDRYVFADSGWKTGAPARPEPGPPITWKSRLLHLLDKVPIVGNVMYKIRLRTGLYYNLRQLNTPYERRSFIRILVRKPEAR